MRREKHARDHEYVHTHCRQVQSPRRCTLALLEAERRGIAHSPSALGPHCLVPPAPQSFAHVPTRIDSIILRTFDWASNPTFEPPPRDVRRFSRVSCGDAPAPPPVVAARWHCGSRAAAGATILLGVHTVANPARRDASRQSWVSWTQSTTTAVCFVVGARLLTPAQRSTLVAEAEDVISLPAIADGGCFLSIEKAHAWWQEAATWLDTNPSVRHVGRADDDVFVNLPQLHASLARLHCLPHAVLGSVAYAGYNAKTFTKCGFSWGFNPKRFNASAFVRYGCQKSGAHAPVPFVNGPLQVLSAALARHVGTDAAVAEFARRAGAARIDPAKYGYDRHEDVALGFWLAHAPLPATFVDIAVKNLGCFKNAGDYRPPDARKVAMHFVKKPSAMSYLFGVFHDGRPHDPYNCTVASGVA